MAQVSKQSFLGGLCSDRNTFSRAAGARRARSEKFSRQCFLFAKTVPTSYRTPASVHGVPNSSERYTYYNIDLGGLCSDWNTFSRAAGVRGMRSEIFFHGLNFFGKTVNSF